LDADPFCPRRSRHRRQCCICRVPRSWAIQKSQGRYRFACNRIPCLPDLAQTG